ncbi:MAG TPA: ATP-binding protein [Kutzneria sp.]
MGGQRNTFTGTNKGNVVQARSIDYVHIERAYDGPLEVGDIRFRTDLPRTLDVGEPQCVGREKELARLEEALERGLSVRLRGPTGIGRTTLLRHAAHLGRLTIPDIEAVVWTPPRLPDADQILHAVLDRCAEYPPERPPVPAPVLRRAMTGLRALVIVEDPQCTAAELAEVLGAMRRSVFVVTTDRTDLACDVDILLAGLPVRASRQVLRSQFNGRLPAATRRRVEQLCEGYGHHPGDVVRLGRYLATARTQRELVPTLDTDEAQLIVPRLVEWLDEPARAAVLALAALDKAEWGWPILAAVAEIPTQRTAKSLRDSKLVVGKQRYRLAAGVVEHVATDVVAVTERITDWVWETVAAAEITAEITVIEQELLVTIRAEQHEVALALARVAATKLAATRQWDAWGRVLPLGLRAAIGAQSRPDQRYFRYSLAARKYADGRREEALELVTALLGDGLDTVDDSTAERMRRLADQVGYRGGTVITTAFDLSAAGAFCQPSSWGQSGVDEVIDVRCFTKAGAPTNMRVFVFFAAGSGANPIAGGGTRSYVVDDQPGAGVFTPDWQHGRNAGGVTRTGVGRYTAELAGAATGVVELTAIGADPSHCSVVGRHGNSVDLACFDSHGTAVDTAFAAGVANNQNFLDDKRKPVGDYLVTAGDPSTQWASGPTVVRTSAGQYHVRFGNGYFPSTMHVTAEGIGRYCIVTNFNDYSHQDDTNV